MSELVLPADAPDEESDDVAVVVVELAERADPDRS
jgi:hypothetical protein